MKGRERIAGCLVLFDDEPLATAGFRLGEIFDTYPWYACDTWLRKQSDRPTATPMTAED